jgi:hypothetical protein
MDGADGEPMTKNRRHRTLRQQMLNKQAQQRYRCGLVSCHASTSWSSPVTNISAASHVLCASDRTKQKVLVLMRRRGL